MERFVVQENIRRFSRLLAETSDDARRQQLRYLIEGERSKLDAIILQGATLPQ